MVCSHSSAWQDSDIDYDDSWREGFRIPTIRFRIPNWDFNSISRDFNQVSSRASTKPVKILMLIMIILMKLSNLKVKVEVILGL